MIKVVLHKNISRVRSFVLWTNIYLLFIATHYYCACQQVNADKFYIRQTLPTLILKQYTNEQLIYSFNGTIDQAYYESLYSNKVVEEKQEDEQSAPKCVFKIASFSKEDIGTRRKLTQLAPEERLLGFVQVQKRIYAFGDFGTIIDIERTQQSQSLKKKPLVGNPILRYAPKHWLLLQLDENSCKLILLSFLLREAQQQQQEQVFPIASQYIARFALVDAVVTGDFVFVAFAQHGVDVYMIQGLDLIYINTVIKIPQFTALLKLQLDQLTGQIYALDETYGIYQILQDSGSQQFKAGETLIQIRNPKTFDVRGGTFWVATQQHEIYEYLRGELNLQINLSKQRCLGLCAIKTSPARGCLNSAQTSLDIEFCEEIVHLCLNDYVMIATTHSLQFFHHSIPKQITAERKIAQISLEDSDAHNIMLFAYENKGAQQTLTFYSAHKNSVSSLPIDVEDARLVCRKNVHEEDLDLTLLAYSRQCAAKQELQAAHAHDGDQGIIGGGSLKGPQQQVCETRQEIQIAVRTRHLFPIQSFFVQLLIIVLLFACVLSGPIIYWRRKKWLNNKVQYDEENSNLNKTSKMQAPGQKKRRQSRQKKDSNQLPNYLELNEMQAEAERNNATQENSSNQQQP